MAKKSNTPVLEKKPAKKRASKKIIPDDQDDFNDPVWIDPKLQSKTASELVKNVNGTKDDSPEKEFNVEVTKAKISNDIFLSASWKIMSKNDKGSYAKEGENPIHEDLKNAFIGLNTHLAKLSEQYNESGALDSDRIVCRGFSIGGNGEGVTLHGSRHLSNGKSFNFNSPFYKWTSDQPELDFAVETNSLKASINICRAEVIKYLFKHKYQPEIQIEEEEKEEVTDPDTMDAEFED
ncbi:MAG: hypothetical protein ABI366_11060 [Ginsengibacter sp.]